MQVFFHLLSDFLLHKPQTSLELLHLGKNILALRKNTGAAEAFPCGKIKGLIRYNALTDFQIFKFPCQETFLLYKTYIKKSVVNEST